MTITRNFKSTIQERALRDPEFRQGLFTESVESMLTGDIETGKLLLRDYINATIGFEKLATLTEKSPKSLMRMLSPKGNPTSNNLFSVIHRIQQQENVQLHIHTGV
ncbi:transcriptional regulator [candidate division KSB1 bacterium]|nr:transcriptional regulator [candidate division KSB1 bacterium]